MWDVIRHVAVPAVDHLAHKAMDAGGSHGSFDSPRRGRSWGHGAATLADGERWLLAELIDLVDRLLAKVHTYHFLGEILADQ